MAISTTYSIILGLGGEQPVHVGDEEGEVSGGTFEGATFEKTFGAPNVSPANAAVLMFRTFGVHHPTNIIQINGTDIPGGIEVSSTGWNTQVAILNPGVLMPTGINQLFVESRNAAGGAGGNLDDFLIGHMVLFYTLA